MKGQVQIIVLLMASAFGISTAVAQNNSNAQVPAQDSQNQDEKAKKEAERQSKKQQKEEEKRAAERAAVRCARLGKKS